MSTVVRVQVDMAALIAGTMDRALQAGIQQVAQAQLAELQRMAPGEQLAVEVRRESGGIVRGIVVAGKRGSSSAYGRPRRGGSGTKAPPRHVLVEWTRAHGLQPRDGRRHRDPVTSVAVAIQRSMATQNAAQRAAKRALARRLTAEPTGTKKETARALGFVTRVMAQAVMQAVRRR